MRTEKEIRQEQVHISTKIDGVWKEDGESKNMNLIIELLLDIRDLLSKPKE